MEEKYERIEQLITQLKEIDYESRKIIFNRVFGIDIYSEELNDKLILISLVALSSNMLKKKDSSLTTLDILKKIFPDELALKKGLLEQLSILSDNLSDGVTKFDNCGLKSSSEIINKIKELGSLWIPF